MNSYVVVDSAKFQALLTENAALHQELAEMYLRNAMLVRSLSQMALAVAPLVSVGRETDCATLIHVMQANAVAIGIMRDITGATSDTRS